MYNKLIKFCFVFTFLFLFSTNAFARESFDILPQEDVVYIGENSYFDVYLHTGEEINGLEFKLSHDNKIKLIRAEEGGTIANYIVTHPNVNENPFTFTGMIMGGFSGYFNPTSQVKSDFAKVVRVVFQPVSVGTTSINITNATFTKNDGLGTIIYPTTQSKTIQILAAKKETKPNNAPTQNNTNTPPVKNTVDKTKDVNTDINKDTTPPYLTAEISKVNMNGKDSYMLFVNAYDSVTGIKKITVQEGKSSPVEIKGSMYLLGDQTLKEQVIVTAYDFTDQSKKVIATLGGQKDVVENTGNDGYMNDMNASNIVLILIGTIVVILIAVYFYTKKRQKREE